MAITIKNKVADASHKVADAAKNVGDKIAKGTENAAELVKEKTGLGAQRRARMQVSAASKSI